MAKVIVSSFLSAEEIQEGASYKIESAKERPADEVKWGRNWLLVLTDGEGKELSHYLPNNTSLKNLVKGFGDESEEWIGKFIKFQIAEQNVKGEMKTVVTAFPNVKKV